MFRHQTFAGAITRGDTEELGRLVDKQRFRAILPGGPAEGLDFTTFVPEMERRRAPFSDFGQDVEVSRVLEDAHRIAVRYMMNLTYDGTLSDWAGSSAPPSGRKVRLTAVDMVTFDAEGLVTELVTESDRMATLRQMGALLG
jgi:predicted ester cyclase